MGEPLRAEVEIAQFTQDELRGLQAQLASPASFKQAGMEYNTALSGVVARVENRNDGPPRIVLTGRSPVQDSFVDLILEAQWTTGRSVKNYALLLNSASATPTGRQAAPSARPPAQTDIMPSRVAAASTAAAPVARDKSPAPSSVEVNANKVPVYRFEAVDAVTATPEVPAPARATATDAPLRIETPSTPGGDTLTLRAGDTLSGLIMGRLPANVSMDQMLLAMVRANPRAFIEGNVNLVRAGSVLRIPSASDANQISRTQARQTVIAQNRDFAAYARRVAESSLLVGAAQSREMSGSVTSGTQKAAPANEKQDKLTLSKAQVDDSAAEAKLAREKEAKDAADQLAALNKNMQDMQALANDRKEASGPASPSVLPEARADDASLMTQLNSNRSMWIWAVGAVLALLAVVFWSRKKDTQSNAVFAPSYGDFPSQPLPAEPAMAMPAQVANIDLNLDNTPAPLAAAVDPADAVTAQNKLILARQLLESGDKELARTLIMSVASTTSSDDLRSRAQHMLGQIA
ncbi:MAG: FimV/HubP family polar landmark protein [Limnohabitans sp.]